MITVILWKRWPVPIDSKERCAKTCGCPNNLKAGWFLWKVRPHQRGWQLFKPVYHTFMICLQYVYHVIIIWLSYLMVVLYLTIIVITRNHTIALYHHNCIVQIVIVWHLPSERYNKRDFQTRTRLSTMVHAGQNTHHVSFGWLEKRRRWRAWGGCQSCCQTKHEQLSGATSLRERKKDQEKGWSWEKVTVFMLFCQLKGDDLYHEEDLQRSIFHCHV